MQNTPHSEPGFEETDKMAAAPERFKMSKYRYLVIINNRHTFFGDIDTAR